MWQKQVVNSFLLRGNVIPIMLFLENVSVRKPSNNTTIRLIQSIFYLCQIASKTD